MCAAAVACQPRDLEGLVDRQRARRVTDQTFKVSRLAGDGGRTHRWQTSNDLGLYAFMLEGKATVRGTLLERRDSMALEREDAVEIGVAADGTDMLLVETRL